MENKMGPNIEPCGTPDGMAAKEDTIKQLRVIKLLLYKKKSKVMQAAF